MSGLTLAEITVGCQVTFLVPNGTRRDGAEYKRKTGRAVMRGPHGWVVNGGGRYGIPYVVNSENFISAKKGRQK